MPVDLSIPNSIIAAYAQGRQEAFQRLKNQQDLEQQQKENEMKQQQFEEQQKEFQDKLKQEHELASKGLSLQQAHLDLQRLVDSMQFQQHAEQTGQAPPGFTMVGEPLPGQLDTGQRTLIGGPEAGGLTLPVRTRQQTLADEVEQLRALTEPKTKAEIEVKNAEKTADFYNKYFENLQNFQYKMLENSSRPTEDIFADRVAKGQTALGLLSQNPNDPNLLKVVQEGKEAQISLDLLAKNKAAGRAPNESLIQKELQGKDIAQAIMEGLQPPDLTRLYGVSAFVRDELARNKYDLTGASKDWLSTTTWIKTLNSDRQVNLRQSVSNLSNSIPILEKLYQEWKTAAGSSEYKIANWVNLQKAKQTGGSIGATATALDAQIADMVSNLAQVYRTGNAPTDDALQLAAKNLSSSWQPETMEKAIDLLKKNLNVRLNSILTAGPAGGSPTNIYNPQGTIPLTPQGQGGIIEYDINGNRIK